MSTATKPARPGLSSFSDITLEQAQANITRHGEPLKLKHCTLTDVHYRAADGKEWRIATINNHTKTRSGYAYTLAEAHAQNEIGAWMGQQGARGLSTIINGPKELAYSFAFPVAGYEDMLLIGDAMARVLLISQLGEPDAVALGLIAAPAAP